MAQGKTVSRNVVVNNVKTTTVARTVELVVVGDQLVANQNEIESGVNSKELKN